MGGTGTGYTETMLTVQDFLNEGGTKGRLFTGEFFRPKNFKVYEILNTQNRLHNRKIIEAELRIFGERYAYWFDLGPHLRDPQATSLDIEIAKQSPFATESIEAMPQLTPIIIEESYDPFSSCYFRDPQ